ncbi:legumin B-like [Salvia miltiorrhiza]|uniref:legumin B-like n=1 Tax=Salvia miltiorrhiza TaxID=226208 RepID=UPI0025AB966D|nr:legumin B-like [Salvia miltiorrhiza]
MEGGERKEEASLPPDYVSLAQLQERWLQKQEEIKRKQKQEEEEKREKQSLALKQKQEEDEKRERDVRAQNERNRNRNQRETGVIEEIGKGKDIVLGGPGDGGENNKKKRKKGKKKRNFRGAAAVEEKGKVGAEAEVLSGEGGSGGGTSGVEEVGYVCVVEVLPRNGEIAHVNRTDLRGEFKKNGRDKGSPRVNVLKQEGVNGGGNKWCVGERGRGVDRGRGAEEDRERGGDRRRGSERGGYRGEGVRVGGIEGEEGKMEAIRRGR